MENPEQPNQGGENIKEAGEVNETPLENNTSPIEAGEVPSTEPQPDKGDALEMETPPLESSPETEEKVSEEVSEEKKKVKKYKIPLKKVFYVILALIVIALVVVGFIWGPKIYRYLNFSSNQYGFDYNFNKVKGHDWDSILTEKKISQAMGVPLQKINTVKNPDYSWVLEAPEQLVNQVICASLLEEKILYEISDTNNNLFNVSIMLCKDTAKTKELFDTRKGNIQLLVSQDESLQIKSIGEPKGLGEGAYNYVLEKKEVIEADPSIEGSTPQDSMSYYSGIVFFRGPFIVRIEESQNNAEPTVLADESIRLDLANQMDKEIKSTLSAF